MKDEIIGAEGEAAFEFSAKGGDGFFVESGVGSGEVDEVVGMDDEGLEIVFAAKEIHGFALRPAERVWLPLTRARREDLERAAAKSIGALGGVFDASGDGGVDADATGCARGRLLGRGPLEGILLGESGGHFSHSKRK